MAEDWLSDVRKYAADADENIVAAIVKYCGVAIQDRDSSLVAMSDANERTLVRENYLKKKLGLTSPDAVLDEAVLAVGQTMKADRTKNRVTVYYLLAQHFGLLGVFGGDNSSSLSNVGFAGGAATLAAMTPAAANASASAGGASAHAIANGGNKRDDFDLFGWGCGALALILSGVILAALLAWYTARPAEVPGFVASSTANSPSPTTPVLAPEIIPEGAGVTSGERDGKPMLTVYFDTAKSDVTKDLATAAVKVKEYVANNAGAKLAVSGFNDPTGNVAANAELSKKRAQAVAKALEDAGVPAVAIELVKPTEATDTSGNNDNARRVEVKVQ